MPYSISEYFGASYLIIFIIFILFFFFFVVVILFFYSFLVLFKISFRLFDAFIVNSYIYIYIFFFQFHISINIQCIILSLRSTTNFIIYFDLSQISEENPISLTFYNRFISLYPTHLFYSWVTNSESFRLISKTKLAALQLREIRINSIIIM